MWIEGRISSQRALKQQGKRKFKKVPVFLNRKRLTSEHRTQYHAQHARSKVEVTTLAAIY
jgi:hypothetical protein